MCERTSFVILYRPMRDGKNSGSDNIYVGVKPLMCRRMSFLSHCVLLSMSTTQLCEQYAIVHKRTSSLFLETMAKNVDDETLMRKCTSNPLAIVRKRTSY